MALRRAAQESCVSQQYEAMGSPFFRFLPRGCSSAAIHVNRHIIHDEANELLHIRYVTQPAALIIAYNDYLVLAPRDLRLVYE